MNETTPPTLETTHLVLRPMSPSDVDPLLALFGARRFMAAFDVEPFDREQMSTWVERNLQHQATHGYGLFSIQLKTDGVLIGDCGLEHMQVEGEDVAELGYDIHPAYWNRGYATEAATAVRDFAFGTLHLPKLVSMIRQSNGASERVAEKIGMTRVKGFDRYGSLYWLYQIIRERE